MSLSLIHIYQLDFLGRAQGAQLVIRTGPRRDALVLQLFKQRADARMRILDIVDRVLHRL